MGYVFIKFHKVEYFIQMGPKARVGSDDPEDRSSSQTIRPPNISCSMPPHFEHSASVCRTARKQPGTNPKNKTKRL